MLQRSGIIAVDIPTCNRVAFRLDSSENESGLGTNLLISGSVGRYGQQAPTYVRPYETITATPTTTLSTASSTRTIRSVWSSCEPQGHTNTFCLTTWSRHFRRSGSDRYKAGSTSSPYVALSPVKRAKTRTYSTESICCTGCEPQPKNGQEKWEDGAAKNRLRLPKDERFTSNSKHNG